MIPKFETKSAKIVTKGEIHELTSQPFITMTENTIIYRQLKIYLNQLLKLPKNNEKFPGNLPVSLMRENIENLYHNKYTYGVLEKTDGLRYLLFFCNYKDQELLPVTVLVNRAFQFTLLTDVLGFPDLHLGTVLDVEYVQISPKEHRFYVFDLLASEGVPHLYDSKMHYINRLYKATTMIEEMIIPGPGIQFHVKEPCAIHKLQDFVQKELPKRRKKVAVDGLIFVPLEKMYQTGQDMDTFKWKSYTDHTVEFVVKFPHVPPSSA